MSMEDEDCGFKYFLEALKGYFKLYKYWGTWVGALLLGVPALYWILKLTYSPSNMALSASYDIGHNSAFIESLMVLIPTILMVSFLFFTGGLIGYYIQIGRRKNG